MRNSRTYMKIKNKQKRQTSARRGLKKLFISLKHRLHVDDNPCQRIKCNIIGYFLLPRIHLQSIPDEDDKFDKKFKCIPSLNSTKMAVKRSFQKTQTQGLKELEWELQQNHVIRKKKDKQKLSRAKRVRCYTVSEESREKHSRLIKTWR